ncbi:2-methylisocitrate lyase-like PEP mutase family enzyme [Geomicrobium halophilum]|uniref:2-methylisocitrate lyase-like PEP mutase family enzyme n=1 Tax=Geomicrobium halophilum TaxID=549000 RepID=A0A841PPP8_9BACL|nr:isocitrate lyase/phosphoenolpyruvate mutase family protein [Geomicrobium halophilum]MBB6450719.1 2-methylisocitrate lyase-like PEP mutase family enzyme [Geomicrobium halophilum]
MQWNQTEHKRHQSYQDFSNGELTMIPAVHDPLSAQTVEQKGFQMAVLPTEDVAKICGYATSYAVNATEMITAARAITQVTSLGLIVQLPMDVRSCQQIIRQVYELRQIGVQVIQFDDEKGFSAGELKQVITQLKHYFPDISIVMTIQADASITGIEEAIKKANESLRSGVDFIYFEGLTTEGEYLYVSQFTNGPLLADMNEKNKQWLSMNQLQEMGYHATIIHGGCIRLMKKMYEEAFEDS